MKIRDKKLVPLQFILLLVTRRFTIFSLLFSVTYPLSGNSGVCVCVGPCGAVKRADCPFLGPKQLQDYHKKTYCRYRRGDIAAYIPPPNPPPPLRPLPPLYLSKTHRFACKLMFGSMRPFLCTNFAHRKCKPHERESSIDAEVQILAIK